MRPFRVVVFIWSVILLLGVMCIFLPERIPVGDCALRWTSLSRVLDLDTSPSSLDSLDLDDTLLLDSVAVFAAADSLARPSFLDSTSTPFDTLSLPIVEGSSSNPFAAFYAALSRSNRQSVRVVHYGDSQIEEDRMTMTLRAALQSQYGGGGVGLLPLQQTIPTRTLRQSLSVNGVVQTLQRGVTRYLVYGPKRMQRADGLYGPMGQVALIGEGASAAFDSLPTSKGDSVVFSFEPMRASDKRSSFNLVRLFASGALQAQIADQCRSLRAPMTTIALPTPMREGSLSLLGHGDVYGISLETDTGVVVDNVPMRGCTGLVFDEIDSVQLATFYAQTNTRLIILQYGGNAIPNNEKTSTIAAIVRGLRAQVGYIKRCAPFASILFVGPGDMLTQKDGEWMTYPLLPYMDRLLAKMAADEQIAYFSLYDMMGGRNSMLLWQKNGWAGSDGVHFTKQGADRAGKALYAFIASFAPPDTISATAAAIPSLNTALPIPTDTASVLSPPSAPTSKPSSSSLSSTPSTSTTISSSSSSPLPPTEVLSDTLSALPSSALPTDTLPTSSQ